MGSLTHFLGYELEALMDLCQPNFARSVLDALREQLRTHGILLSGCGAITGERFYLDAHLPSSLSCFNAFLKESGFFMS